MYSKYEDSQKRLIPFTKLNYQYLRNIIISVTIAAFVLCLFSFILILNIDGTGLKFSDASSVAQLLPSFAGIIIASIALYAYIKLEDNDHKQASKISKKSKKVIIILDTWLSAFELFTINRNLKLFKSNILAHKDELEELMYDGEIMLFLSLIHKNDINYRKKIIECIRDLTSFFDEIEGSEDKDFIEQKSGFIDNNPERRSMYRFLQNVDFIFKELRAIDTYQEVFKISIKLNDNGYEPAMMDKLQEYKSLGWFKNK